jgi:hypothetical protein
MNVVGASTFTLSAAARHFHKRGGFRRSFFFGLATLRDQCERKSLQPKTENGHPLSKRPGNATTP